MMSLSSCRVVSTLSRVDRLAATYIADSGIFVHACLEVLEDGRVDHA
jgi:hypothetical protein